MPKYRVTVTRDTSESVEVTVEADSPVAADHAAIDYVTLDPTAGEVDWTMDDYAGKPYVGDPGNAEQVELCRAVGDVRDGPYSAPAPWLVCDLPKGHTGPHTEVDVKDLLD